MNEVIINLSFERWEVLASQIEKEKEGRGV